MTFSFSRRFKIKGCFKKRGNGLGQIGIAPIAHPLRIAPVRDKPDFL